MIVIDKSAYTKLIKKLEESLKRTDLELCTYFRLSNKPEISGIKEKIIESAQKNIFSPQLQIYLCEDGDISVLIPEMNNRNVHHFLLEVSSYANLGVNNDLVKIYDLKTQISNLLTMLENKVEKHHEEVESAQKKNEIEQVQRKRQMILSNNFPNNKISDIPARRNARKKPEFMIVEDDAFSRRLVENALKKQYSLTSLSTADLAISTYISLAPDILFLDINLPDVTGHELLEKIMEIDPDAYVLMLSGNSDHTNVIQAVNLGAKGFVAKPFARDRLFQYINRCPTIKH